MEEFDDACVRFPQDSGVDEGAAGAAALMAAADNGARKTLMAAAAHMAAAACGEGWLLQPRLRDFDSSEYRRAI